MSATFFEKSCRSQHGTLLKKRLWHRFFPENFVKFLRITFSRNNSGGLLPHLFLQFHNIRLHLLERKNKSAEYAWWNDLTWYFLRPEMQEVVLDGFVSLMFYLLEEKEESIFKNCSCHMIFLIILFQKLYCVGSLGFVREHFLCCPYRSNNKKNISEFGTVDTWHISSNRNNIPPDKIFQIWPLQHLMKQSKNVIIIRTLHITFENWILNIMI